MVLVSIDDKKAEVLPEAPRTLEAFLNGIVSSLPPDRVVTEVFLNGSRLPALSRLAGFEFEGMENLQIRTASKRMWAADGVENALQSIQRLQQSFLRATEIYLEADPSEARGCLGRCLDGAEKFLETMCIAQNVLELDFSSLSVGNSSLRQIELELASIIGQLKDPAVLSDVEAVAERVEYELLPNLHAWNAALRQLQQRASSPSHLED
ncbi:MAG: hypothetical protein H6617_11465 [Bdellovibrionaceae bacterium]|nr:hypothetical protein [Bdellovibrionales bacterium]MCB9255291.1 hypothetical protein [Pseudobdellovibrionaceae bacterium]